MLRTGKQAFGRSQLNHMAEINHHHLISNMTHHRQIVADKHIGQPEFFLQLGQQIQHLRADRHIKRRHRFIQHQNFGPQHQSAGDGDALTLPARKHVRITIGIFGPQTNPLHHTGNRLFALGA